MGRTAKVKSYNYKQLVQEIKNYFETDNEELIEKILISGGSKVADRYIILDNEYNEEYNSCFSVTSVLNKVFGSDTTDDVFGNVFCTFDNKADCKSIAPNMAFYDICEACGLDILDSDY